MVTERPEWLQDLPLCERIMIGQGQNAERIAHVAELLRLAADWCDAHPGRIVRDVTVDLYQGFLTLYVEREED